MCDLNEEDESSEDGDKVSGTPGPGQYNLNMLASIRPQYKEERFQCFGSNEDREKTSFFEANAHKNKGSPSLVGPGSYNLRKEPLLYQRKMNQTA